MRSILWAVPLALQVSCALVKSKEELAIQYPLIFPVSEIAKLTSGASVHDKPPKRKLHGRFLWITDIHPDSFYETGRVTDVCHHGKGDSGYYGAPMATCDTPFSLVNATFDWIEKNLADKIDFVVWTGDSARHDNDEKIPRTEPQVLTLNRDIAGKMVDVFGRNDDGDQSPKVIPTFGNNDILPHNIMAVGPNSWTTSYLNLWEAFIPEEQKHTFAMGGFHFVEVIPDRLAVFSLNSLYFFAKNAAVDGCLDPEEPGAHQFKWLRVQLQRMRERGMKVLIMGHVPPARTWSKMLWDESCWQMYTLFMHQFRDIIVASMYGHMDWDHFMFQDFSEVTLLDADYEAAEEGEREFLEDDNGINVMGVQSYMTELAEDWATLPKVPKKLFDHSAHKSDLEGEKKKKKKKKKHRKGKGHKSLGGEWAEMFSMSFASPSVIPAYYPTIRVVEYNITDADEAAVIPRLDQEEEEEMVVEVNDLKRRAKKGKAQKKSKIKVPKGPSKSAPPGPAYSPQTFSWLGYTQYYANITEFNEAMSGAGANSQGEAGYSADESRHQSKNGKKPKFEFEVEYDTRTDKTMELKETTIRGFLHMAKQIGKGAAATKSDNKKDKSKDVVSNPDDVDTDNKNKEKKKKQEKKDKQKKEQKKMWLAFLRRVYVGSATDDQLIQTYGLNISSEEASTQHGNTEDPLELNYEL